MAWKPVIFIVLALLAGCSKAPESPVVSTPTPVATPVAAPASPQTIAWVRPEGADIDPIFAKARAENTPVYLYWGAVWCPPCNQIKATVFNRQDFMERSKLFVPVYLDGDTPGAQKLGARFKVRGYPTMILFRPDGTELTRLPGEVDAAKYVEMLGWGMASGASAKESLDAALNGKGATLAADAWRMLAYYAWDQDEAQLVPKKELAATLHRLAKACPPTQTEASTRLALKAMLASAQDKAGLPDRAASLARVQALLADTAMARENFDVLVNYSTLLFPALAPQGSPEQARLLALFNTSLDRFATDATLSRSDRLSAVSTKVALAKLDAPKTEKPKLDAALMAQAREAAATADKATTNTYERQAVIPSAADLLSEAGLLDESDAMLKAELPKAVSPYYHMLGLAGNAKLRGDKTASLDWAEKAWAASSGSATRLQWGISYVSRLLELSPADTPRIEKAAAGVLQELEPTPETFYERNRRGLERMGQRLTAWNGKGQHTATLNKLAKQLDAVCAKLPPGDEARTACSGVFKPKAG